MDEGNFSGQKTGIFNLNVKVFTIIGIWILVHASGCFLQRTSHYVAAVPPGCAACHEAVADITGPEHPVTEKGDIPYCRTCHVENGDASPLSGTIHLGHFASSDFSGDCWSCHFMDETNGFRIVGDEKKLDVAKETVDKMTPYFHTWGNSSFLDSTHAQAGVDCVGCHDTYFPENGLSLDDCLRCHGSYDDLIKATEKVEPNPHDSHYMDLRCTLCHKGHQDSELYCNTCHEFDLKVP